MREVARRHPVLDVEPLEELLGFPAGVHSVPIRSQLFHHPKRTHVRSEDSQQLSCGAVLAVVDAQPVAVATNKHHVVLSRHLKIVRRYLLKRVIRRWEFRWWRRRLTWCNPDTRPASGSPSFQVTLHAWPVHYLSCPLRHSRYSTMPTVEDISSKAPQSLWHNHPSAHHHHIVHTGQVFPLWKEFQQVPRPFCFVSRYAPRNHLPQIHNDLIPT